MSSLESLQQQLRALLRDADKLHTDVSNYVVSAILQSSKMKMSRLDTIRSDTEIDKN